MGNTVGSGNSSASSDVPTLTTIPKSPAQLHAQIREHVSLLHSTMRLGARSPEEEISEIVSESVLNEELPPKDSTSVPHITLRTIIDKYEELVPVKLHVVMFYEWATQLMNVLRVEERDAGTTAPSSVADTRVADAEVGVGGKPTHRPPTSPGVPSAEQENNPGAEHLELTPEWTQFLIELYQRAIESFELYCVPVSTNNGDMLEMQQKSNAGKKVSSKKLPENVHVIDVKNADSEVRAVVEKQSTLPNDTTPKSDGSSTSTDTSSSSQQKTDPDNSSSTEFQPDSQSSLQQYLSQHFPQIERSSLKQDSSLQELYLYYLKSHVQLAHLLYERKQYKEALSHYIAGQYRNHFRLACLYYSIDEHADAIAEYKKIPNYDQDIYTLNNIGVAHEEMGEWEQAKKYYEKALNLNPDYGMARLNLRTVQWKLEQRKKYSSKSGQNATVDLEDVQDLGFGGVSSSDTKLKVLLRKMSLGIVTHMEYAQLADEAYYYLPSWGATSTSTSSNKQHTHTPQHRTLPPHWEILTTADRVSLARNGYFAIAFVNHLSRCVVISTRGTDDGAGVRADFWLIFDEFSIQFALARGFSRMVRLLMRDRGIGSYRVSYTGHSLGAAIGDFLCWEEQVSGVTFDSPGCRELIETERLRRLTRNRENPAHEVQETLPHAMDPFAVDVVTYLTAPNLINTIKPHIGLRIRIFPSSIDDPSQKAAAAAAQKEAASASKALPFYVRWVAPTTALQSFEYVYKELDKLIQHTSQQHEMKNIAKTLSEPNPKERVLSWPCGPFQCWTFYKGFPKLAQYTGVINAGHDGSSQQYGTASRQSKSSHLKLSDASDVKHFHKSHSTPTNHTIEQEEILRSVFEDSVHNMAQYRTTYYDESTIPLKFFSRDEINILRQFAALGAHPEILSSQNTKLLRSYVVEDNMLRVTSFLSGCEFKQFIKINKRIMEDLIRTYAAAEVVKTVPKNSVDKDRKVPPPVGIPSKL